MTVQWMYLDKRAASVSAIRDLPSMRHIMANYQDDIDESKSHLTAVHGVMPSGMRGGGINPHANESQMASTLDLIDVVETRHDLACEYMAWFLPAWDALSDTERYLLSSFYHPIEKSIAEMIKEVCEALGYERSSIYRMRDKALDHITLLLYGR